MKTRAAALVSALLLGALAGAGGCADNRASVQIQAICVPTDDCTFGDTCDAQYIGYPTLDKTTSASDDVWLLLQVENQLPDNGDLGLGRVNTNDAHIDETEVEYEGALGGVQSIGSNFLVPAGGSAVVSARLALDAAIAGTATAPTEVVANLRFKGYYDDGTRFETGEFPITILVCGGCATGGCLTGTCPPDSAGQLPLTCLQ